MNPSNDKRLKLGLVGLNFGSWIIENEITQGPGSEFVELAAVCDINTEKSASWARKLGVKGYASLTKLLDDPEIEVVGLFTGPVNRAELIDQIISSGRDVITTKPFERSAEKAARVLDKAARSGRIVQLNSPSPQMPADLAQIHDWIHQCHLGRPIAYRASTWCSYREKPDNSWYDDPGQCPVAPIFRLGIYLINDVSWFFDRVVDVKVLQSRIFTQRPTADNAQLSILYANGAIGNIFASFCINDRQFYRCTLEINFENGTIYRNMGPLQEAATKDSTLLEISTSLNGEQIIKQQALPSAGAGYQWDVFYRSVKGEIIPGLVTSDQIVSGIRTIELMREQA
ncbi:MAG: Gfo/Idh/MocA family oxidoreductase [Anaerolineae bacterium]|nr:Gfo/Idh/MocA family oxidoreductase [Anaerolineae bacterium]